MSQRPSSGPPSAPAPQPTESAGGAQAPAPSAKWEQTNAGQVAGEIRGPQPAAGSGGGGNAEEWAGKILDVGAARDGSLFDRLNKQLRSAAAREHLHEVEAREDLKRVLPPLDLTKKPGPSHGH